MNAERLHAIVRKIREELSATNQVALITQLVQHLQNQVNHLGEP